jgi:dimethylglycine catabolism B
MRGLPMLEGRRAELERCVFCPKLSRAACPVSNAEPRETLTPWGKMTTAWMAAHGDVPIDLTHTAPAWACTECLACREACEHHNPVADVLVEARDALVRAGPVPSGASRARHGFDQHVTRTRAAAQALRDRARLRDDTRSALFVGCVYLRAAKREARDAVDAVSALEGAPVALIDTCCGLPLRLAGDLRGFERHATAVARVLAKYEEILVLDAGCAITLLNRYTKEAGIALLPRITLVIERAAQALQRLKPLPDAHAEAIRWHDPCQLGRGLARYEAPRAILSRILGAPPAELEEGRSESVCSGAGGLLPWTMPEVAHAIADARLAAHARSGGGRIVTACGSSLLLLRKRARGSVAIDDLVSWIARATRGDAITSSSSGR